MSSGQAKAEENKDNYIQLCKEMGEEPRGLGLYEYDHNHAVLLEARSLGKEKEWLKYLSYKENCNFIGTRTHITNEYTTNVRRDDFGFDVDRATLVAELAEDRRSLLCRQSQVLEEFDLLEVI